MDKDQWKDDIQALYDAAEKRGNSTMRMMARGDDLDVL